MATYQELFQIANDTPPALAEKIRIGIVVKAQAIAASPTSTEKQGAWALNALRNPSGDTQTVLNYILGAYKSAAVSAITGANDATVQTAVDNAVDQLLGV
jgi:hypothetical protein